MFLTDDDVFLKTVCSKDLKKMIDIYENNNQVHSISFRMNPVINYCYPAKKEMSLPEFIHKDSDYLLWDWRKCDTFTCWGYPMSSNSHLYNREETCSLIETLSFNNVNSLEAGLDQNRFDRPLLLSFAETKIFNVQNNFVQGIRINESVQGNTTEELNKKFLNSQIIDTKNIYEYSPSMAHGTIEYKFIKKSEYNEYDDFLQKKSGYSF